MYNQLLSFADGRWAGLGRKSPANFGKHQEEHCLVAKPQANLGPVAARQRVHRLKEGPLFLFSKFPLR